MVTPGSILNTEQEPFGQEQLGEFATMFAHLNDDVSARPEIGSDAISLDGERFGAGASVDEIGS